MTTKANSEMLLPLESVAELAKPATTACERRTGSHHVDLTEAYVGTSVIITGAKKPT
jgi:hypothetical protein